MSLGNAIGYLTAVRVPARRQVPLGFSLHYFPWVGAALGSLSILIFLLANRLLPNVVCCVIAVLVPSLLTGWDSWRGVAERLQDHKTHPGHGFRGAFRFEPRALGVLAGIFVIKLAALISLPFEWQTRVLLLYPILGVCARTAAFLIRPAKAEPAKKMSPALARSRVRAGFLSAFLVFLVFLFPVAVALPLVAVLAGAVWYWVRRENRRTHGLTLQTASTASEMTEVLTLVVLAIAAPFLAT